jgi:hypothetical protein
MRKTYFMWMLIIGLLAACAPADVTSTEALPTEAPMTEAPTEELPTEAPTVAPPTEPPSAATAITPTHLANLTTAERAAIEAVAENFNLRTREITLLSSEPEEWGDGCLETGQEGIACTQAITPGYRILLEAEGKQMEYRTNEDGSLIRPGTVLMTWRREGGIAGFCDVMTVYLSGEVQVSACDGSRSPVEVRLAEVQTGQQINQLEQWTQEYGTVFIEMADPESVSDRMVITLEFFGLGGQQSLAAGDEQQMLDFAQSLHQTVVN